MADILLEKIKTYFQETAKKHNPYGVIWNINARNIEKTLAASHGAMDFLKRISSDDYYSVNRDGWQRDYMISWHRDYLERMGFSLKSAPREVSDIDLGARSKEIDGRMITSNTLYKLIMYLRMGKYFDFSGIQRIFELGAGDGQLAKIIHSFHPHMKYVITDIPHTLITAFANLSLSFPEKKILLVSTKEDLQGMDAYDFVLVPTFLAENILKYDFDLCINTCSMGEMRNDDIRYWMDFIQNKLNPKYFYGVNRFLNIIRQDIWHIIKRNMGNIVRPHPIRLMRNIAHHRNNENEGSVLFDNKWDMVQWEVEPDFTGCPVGNQIEPRYLEIAAKKRAEPIAQEVAKDIISYIYIYTIGIKALSMKQRCSPIHCAMIPPKKEFCLNYGIQ